MSCARLCICILFVYASLKPLCAWICRETGCELSMFVASTSISLVRRCVLFKKSAYTDHLTSHIVHRTLYILLVDKH
jgi:hypothetical protein